MKGVIVFRGKGYWRVVELCEDGGNGAESLEWWARLREHLRCLVLEGAGVGVDEVSWVIAWMFVGKEMREIIREVWESPVDGSLWEDWERRRGEEEKRRRGEEETI